MNSVKKKKKKKKNNNKGLQQPKIYRDSVL